MGHFGLCTAKDYVLHKLINYLHIREQINYLYLLTEGKKSVTKPVEKKLLDPEAASFIPSANKSEKAPNKEKQGEDNKTQDKNAKTTVE